MDEQMIELAARAIAEADGIVLPTHATVHMLAASDGWAVAKRYERLARAAHSVMAGKVAELTEACGDALELLNRNIITPDALNAVGEKLAAALAPHPKGME